MVGQFDQLVDVVPYPVQMVGKVRDVREPLLFLHLAVQDQPSQQGAYGSPLRDVQMVGFADGSQFFIFPIVETQHYVMVPLPFSQSFPAFFPWFHFSCFFSENTSAEVDNSELLRIQLAIRSTDKYKRLILNISN